MTNPHIESIDSTVARLGVVLEPNGDPVEAEGVLNPASARTREGKLLLYPRLVAAGNRSRIGIVEVGGTEERRVYARAGFALEPTEPYELRSVGDGFGCEDPRVTFVPVLDLYLMAYTAFGPLGPRIAVATSRDGYAWERLGLVDFSAAGITVGDDKDGAFFPEPVISPNGVSSIAMYHRPTVRFWAGEIEASTDRILAQPPNMRESMRVAYIPLAPVLDDLSALLHVSESILVLEPDRDWSRIKTGAGTPPVRIDEGWLSVYHGVDPNVLSDGTTRGLRYGAGILIHDAERPHIVLYRSPEPVMEPQTPEELRGTVNNVVFPTAIDVVPGSPPRTFDIYYGMADTRIGRAGLRLGATHVQNVESEESAA